MRKFYVFNVNKETSIISKESPYILFKSFESIYNADRSDFNMAKTLYGQLSLKFNRNMLDQKIISNYKDNQYYIFNGKEHKYYNKYKDELCNMIIKNSYIQVITNSSKIKLLNNIKGYNLFVCDFENKDYFWLNEICC